MNEKTIKSFQSRKGFSSHSDYSNTDSDRKVTRKVASTLPTTATDINMNAQLQVQIVKLRPSPCITQDKDNRLDQGEQDNSLASLNFRLIMVAYGRTKTDLAAERLNQNFLKIQ